jgi:hypothetical protein
LISFALELPLPDSIYLIFERRIKKRAGNFFFTDNLSFNKKKFKGISIFTPISVNLNLKINYDLEDLLLPHRRH